MKAGFLDHPAPTLPHCSRLYLLNHHFCLKPVSNPSQTRLNHVSTMCLYLLNHSTIYSTTQPFTQHCLKPVSNMSQPCLNHVSTMSPHLLNHLLNQSFLLSFCVFGARDGRGAFTQPFLDTLISDGRFNQRGITELFVAQPLSAPIGPSPYRPWPLSAPIGTSPYRPISAPAPIGPSAPVGPRPYTALDPAPTATLRRLVWGDGGMA